MTAQAILAGGIGIAACIDDLRRRQIANWIPGLALASGLALQTVQHGWRGMGAALLGTLAGAGVFLIFYLLGGMGGGDVKLMAGFGALLGAKQLFQRCFMDGRMRRSNGTGVIAGGAVRDLWARRKSLGSAAAAPRPAQKMDSIPYAPAIAAGVWLSLLGRT